MEKRTPDNTKIKMYTTSWCGPCKVLKPIMEKLSDEFKDKANFYYADIDEKAINSASAAAVRGVPTVVVYKKGIEAVSYTHLRAHETDS